MIVRLFAVLRSLPGGGLALYNNFGNALGFLLALLLLGLGLFRMKVAVLVESC